MYCYCLLFFQKRMFMSSVSAVTWHGTCNLKPYDLVTSNWFHSNPVGCWFHTLVNDTLSAPPKSSKMQCCCRVWFLSAVATTGGWNFNHRKIWGQNILDLHANHFFFQRKIKLMVAFLQSAQATAEKEQTKLKFEVKGCGPMMQSRNNESIDALVILVFWWFHSMFLEALKRAVDGPSLSLLVPTFWWRKPTEKLNKQPWNQQCLAYITLFPTTVLVGFKSLGRGLVQCKPLKSN